MAQKWFQKTRNNNSWCHENCDIHPFLVNSCRVEMFSYEVTVHVYHEKSVANEKLLARKPYQNGNNLHHSNFDIKSIGSSTTF